MLVEGVLFCKDYLLHILCLCELPFGRVAWLFVFISSICGIPVDWIIVRCLWSSSDYDYHNGENSCVCMLVYVFVYVCVWYRSGTVLSSFHV